MSTLPAGGRRRKVRRPAPTHFDSYPPIAPEDLPADIVLSRLRGVSHYGHNQWSACCPAHADSRPSLSVTETADLKLLIYCHAGCPLDAILAAIGLKAHHLFPSGYAVFRALKSGRKSPTITPSHPQPSAAGSEDVITAIWSAHFEILARAGWAGAVGHLPYLAGQLGLPESCLEALGVGYLRQLSNLVGWTFPEYDGRGRVVGVVMRDNDGSKRAISSSQRGLTLPRVLLNKGSLLPAGTLFVAEGATDTAALLSIGLLAIGRPAASPSVRVKTFLSELFVTWPALHTGREVVVVGDNDAHGAGHSGALATRAFLAATLGRPVHVARPPERFKDIREEVAAGAAAEGLIFLRSEG